MNKKGFLLGEETLKIIIAIICIIFLVYLLISIYNAHLRNKDLELAKASLEHLIKEINAGKTEVRIYNPKNWYISSFPQIEGLPVRYGEILPDYCSKRRWENCICICGIGGENTKISLLPSQELKEAGKEECDNLGTCLKSEFIIEGGLFRNIMIEPPLVLSINHENKIISEKIEIKTGEEEFGGGGGGATRDF